MGTSRGLGLIGLLLNHITDLCSVYILFHGQRELLKMLATNAGKAVTHRLLLSAVWGRHMKTKIIICRFISVKYGGKLNRILLNQSISSQNQVWAIGLFRLVKGGGIRVKMTLIGISRTDNHQIVNCFLARLYEHSMCLLSGLIEHPTHVETVTCLTNKHI